MWAFPYILITTNLKQLNSARTEAIYKKREGRDNTRARIVIILYKKVLKVCVYEKYA